MRYIKYLAFILAILILTIVGLFIYLLGPKDSSASGTQLYVVTSGETRASISEKLAKDNFIRSSYAFFLYSKITSRKIVPGTYEFSPSYSGSRIAGMMSEGDYKVVKITIIEGWRASQITSYLVSEKGLKQLADFTSKAEAYEGYLFPDTYEIKYDITSDELVRVLKDNFAKRTEGLDVSKQTIIIASIVEREAQTDYERQEIAAVYLNRLKIGMKLEADPTVQYAKGSWAAPTVADYTSTVSPYNTYLNAGLPPGPICNPGLASIRATINPAQSDYLYFFQARGQLYLSKTLSEHQAKIREYF